MDLLTERDPVRDALVLGYLLATGGFFFQAFLNALAREF